MPRIPAMLSEFLFAQHARRGELVGVGNLESERLDRNLETIPLASSWVKLRTRQRKKWKHRPRRRRITLS
jgi:hypothetical protein